MAEIAPSIFLVSSIGDLQYIRGSFTVNGTASVTVVAPQVTPTSSIDITMKTPGGTVGAVPAIPTITPGVGFTVVASAGDTSTYNFTITG